MGCIPIMLLVRYLLQNKSWIYSNKKQNKLKSFKFPEDDSSEYTTSPWESGHFGSMHVEAEEKNESGCIDSNIAENNPDENVTTIVSNCNSATTSYETGKRSGSPKSKNSPAVHGKAEESGDFCETELTSSKLDKGENTWTTVHVSSSQPGVATAEMSSFSLRVSECEHSLKESSLLQSIDGNKKLMHSASFESKPLKSFTESPCAEVSSQSLTKSSTTEPTKLPEIDSDLVSSCFVAVECSNASQSLSEIRHQAASRKLESIKEEPKSLIKTAMFSKELDSEDSMSVQISKTLNSTASKATTNEEVLISQETENISESANFETLDMTQRNDQSGNLNVGDEQETQTSIVSLTQQSAQTSMKVSVVVAEKTNSSEEKSYADNVTAEEPQENGVSQVSMFDVIKSVRLAQETTSLQGENLPNVLEKENPADAISLEIKREQPEPSLANPSHKRSQPHSASYSHRATQRITPKAFQSLKPLDVTYGNCCVQDHLPQTTGNVAGLKVATNLHTALEEVQYSMAPVSDASMSPESLEEKICVDLLQKNVAESCPQSMAMHVVQSEFSHPPDNPQNPSLEYSSPGSHQPLTIHLVSLDSPQPLETPHNTSTEFPRSIDKDQPLTLHLVSSEFLHSPETPHDTSLEFSPHAERVQPLPMQVASSEFPNTTETPNNALPGYFYQSSVSHLASSPAPQCPTPVMSSVELPCYNFKHVISKEKIQKPKSNKERDEMQQRYSTPLIASNQANQQPMSFHPLSVNQPISNVEIQLAHDQQIIPGVLPVFKPCFCRLKHQNELSHCKPLQDSMRTFTEQPSDIDRVSHMQKKNISFMKINQRSSDLSQPDHVQTNRINQPDHVQTISKRNFNSYEPNDFYWDNNEETVKLTENRQREKAMTVTIGRERETKMLSLSAGVLCQGCCSDCNSTIHGTPTGNESSKPKCMYIRTGYERNKSIKPAGTSQPSSHESEGRASFLNLCPDIRPAEPQVPQLRTQENKSLKKRICEEFLNKLQVHEAGETYCSSRIDLGRANAQLSASCLAQDKISMTSSDVVRYWVKNSPILPNYYNNKRLEEPASTSTEAMRSTSRGISLQSGAESSSFDQLEDSSPILYPSAG